jgi:indole-3-glycerol phosphate synthase
VNILDKIVAHKKDEVARLKRKGVSHPEAEIAPLRDFRVALVAGDNRKGVSVIAEVKRASPSKGLLCPDFDPLAIAADYERGGAAAVSVLTDEQFFKGSLSYLPLIRSAISLPILRKDFIIDHIQVEEAMFWGADAMLLIVAVLEFSLLSELLDHARELGLDCLVEVHDEREMEIALKAGADLMGVNNRNLKDFSISLETTFRLKKIVGDAVPIVSESGIGGPDDMKRLSDAGVSAALVGEGLIKARDRVSTLRDLIRAGRS